MGLAYIGIGSNVEREQNIRSALTALSTLGSNLRISSVYESPAYGFAGDNFYNLVTGFETSFSPQDLSVKLGQIEDGLGRLRNVPRFSSRTLDLDLLLYDDLVIHEDSLDLPRSDIESYAFVLCPLAEIAADTLHPEKGLKISKIWAEFDKTEQKIWKVEVDLSIQEDLHT
jgi:2-amino-4-hydroxy-6-hydroxymethyldihydropteridine diphosphokinase